jgi:hypothetical protein
MIQNFWKPRPNPTIALRKWSDVVEVVDLCGNCLEEAEAIHEAGRQVLWNKLPSLFDLPFWSRLKNCEM